MSITSTVATNLSAWMSDHPTLKTVQQVADKSKVGFGTVRRARKGEGNLTIQNLEAIAGAFGRRPEELLVSDYKKGNVTELAAREPAIVEELLAVAKTMSERGQIELLGRAKELAIAHPSRAKAKRAK